MYFILEGYVGIGFERFSSSKKGCETLGHQDNKIITHYLDSKASEFFGDFYIFN